MNRNLVRGMTLLCLLGPVPPTPAADLTVDDMLGSFGFEPDERKAIVEGEIVSRSQAELEGSKKGLAIAVAMIIPHKVEDCVETFAGTKMFRVDPELLDFGVIDVAEGRVQAEGFARVGFGESEVKETEGLVDFGGGSDFNLSKSEIQVFRGLDGSNRRAVNGAYQRLLTTRFESYLRKGLDGGAETGVW